MLFGLFNRILTFDNYTRLHLVLACTVNKMISYGSLWAGTGHMHFAFAYFNQSIKIYFLNYNTIILQCINASTQTTAIVALCSLNWPPKQTKNTDINTSEMTKDRRGNNKCKERPTYLHIIQKQIRST